MRDTLFFLKLLNTLLTHVVCGVVCATLEKKNSFIVTCRSGCTMIIIVTDSVKRKLLIVQDVFKNFRTSIHLV